MTIQKHTAALALVVLLSQPAAKAEMPASQFGVSIWPMRQSVSCATETPDSHATPQPDVTLAPNTPVVPTNAPVEPTGTPAVPTHSIAPSTPPITATPAPTAIPDAMPTVTSSHPTKTPSIEQDYPSDSLSSLESTALRLLNEDRARNGLPALEADPELSRIARIKSEDMRDNNYFAHESPTYGRVSDMLRHFGYSFKGAGENIAHHATVEKSQAAFMSSDGHRRNILSTAWTKVGVGVCRDRNGFVYVTQIFAR